MGEPGSSMGALPLFLQQRTHVVTQSLPQFFVISKRSHVKHAGVNVNGTGAMWTRYTSSSLMFTLTGSKSNGVYPQSYHH